MSKRLKEENVSNIAVLICGLPGLSCVEICQVCIQHGFSLLPIGLTGPGMPESMEIEGITIRLIAPDAENIKDQIVQAVNDFKDAGSKSNGVSASSSVLLSSTGDRFVIAVDFSHPSAVNRNADLFNSIQLPFIMGTTGGDRDMLMESTKTSKNFAVIAPNMCKQIVALQSMLERAAKEFPGCFQGYSLDVVESHQFGKADTSGTAKEIINSFNALRAPDKSFGYDEIQMIREPSKQIEFGVPESAIKGHSFHTYTLRSSDGSVSFQFQHNVCGRRTYADGVIDTINFLIKQIKENEDKKRVFHMIDVLEAGAMQQVYPSPTKSTIILSF